MTVLVVRLSAMGDIVHTVPMVTALRRARPDVRIDWLVDRRHAEVLEIMPAADRVITIDPSGAWRRIVGTIRAARRTGYDAAFDAQGLIKSAMLARLAGGARTIGFARSALREPAAASFYTETVDPGEFGHVVRKNLRLLRALGIDDERVEIRVPPVDSPIVADVEAAIGQRYGIVNPGAGWPNKCWPPERWGAVAAIAQQRHGLPWVVVWGPSEEPLARRVEEASEGAAMLAPTTSLTDLMALVQRAAIVVSGDTGPVHLAAAAGTPVVGVYGPTDPLRNGPWSAADICVSRYEQCRCHHKRRCTASSWCLDSIGIDEVMEAVERRLTA